MNFKKILLWGFELILIVILSVITVYYIDLKKTGTIKNNDITIFYTKESFFGRVGLVLSVLKANILSPFKCEKHQMLRAEDSKCVHLCRSITYTYKKRIKTGAKWSHQKGTRSWGCESCPIDKPNINKDTNICY